MKRFISLTTVCLISAVRTFAVTVEGIHFEESLSWVQVQAKAKAEHKGIFLDCCATWCGPCKEMDKEVYTQPQVGVYFDEHFVCVKVQVDETKQDNDQTVAWRTDTKRIVEAYKVTAYPTFLFFSPDGEALHKAVGSVSPAGFVDLGKQAVDPAKQYYTRLRRFLDAQDRSSGSALLEEVRALDGSDAARSVGLNYIEHHLAGLGAEELAGKDIIQFLLDFQSDNPALESLGSSSRIFNVLNQRTHVADLDAFWELARFFVDQVIASEEIAPKLWTGTGENRKPATESPDWDALSAAIEKKYTLAQSRRIVCYSRLDWFARRHENSAAARAWLDYIDLPGTRIKDGIIDSPEYLNRTNFGLVFRSCTDPGVLARGIELERAVLNVTKPETEDWYKYADTLANLLYKAGSTQEGIALETKAAEKAEAALAGRWGKIFRDRIEKMTQGLPTWDDKTISGRSGAG